MMRPVQQPRTQRMADDPRYRAFISYSHDDQAQARWLHNKLETYRIPARLVGQTTTRGPVPSRLAPIFRDREDLPASSDLSASVREALSRSDALVVLCSPSAARSRWVNEEIRAFRDVNPGGVVLAAIIAGEPYAEAAGLAADQECFPEALRVRVEGEPEPVAADFRETGDGRRMAQLKLVAGLLDLPLDQLIQRDLQRRQRRVTVITGASIALSLIMAALALLAVSAQSEAERRKAEAEDLIEFMLNDLRLKLEPVGRLDVLDAVGAKVIEYYEGQNPGQMSLDDLGRRSRAFHLLGRIDSAEGDLDGAVHHFQTAYDATSRILAVEPTSPARIYEHAQSTYYVGYFAWRMSDLDTAEARFIEYRDLSSQLVAAEPDNLEYLSEAAYAHSNLGTLYVGRGDLVPAREAFAQSLILFRHIAELTPDSEPAWIDVADAHAWLGLVREALEGREPAIREILSQIAIYDEHLTDADNWNVRRSAIGAEYALARLYISEGRDSRPEDVQMALDILRTASHEADALVDRDPSNVEWRLLGIRQRIWLAEASLLQGHIDGARRAYLDATRFMTHPSWATVEGQRFEETRLQALLIEAQLFLAMGDDEAARLSLEHLLVELEQFDDWNSRLFKGTYLYAATSNTFAELLERQGEMREAIRLREAMVNRLTPYLDRLPLDTRAQIRQAEAALSAERLSAE
jgi:tetratricopeptide (TPR) repeat protein